MNMEGIKELLQDNAAEGLITVVSYSYYCEYDTWRLRIESYIQLQDYTLWEIIEEGNSFKPVARTTTNKYGTSTTTIPGAVTAEQKILKKNDLKARSILMMTLPSEHLLTFNKHKDAKSLFEAIKVRFGGNEAIKKTQKTLLKQMYETFNASSSESLDFIFNRLQKIISQLTILGENITPEELNLKFLRSLPTKWGMHVMVWRNKSDLGLISFDYLYNNFKIVEPEVKRNVISSTNSGSQNLAFLSGHSSTNDVNTTNVHVSTASTKNSTACLSDATIYAYLATQPKGSQVVHEDLEQIHEDDLNEMDLKWQLALLSMKEINFYQKTGKKIIINGSDTAGYDKKKVKYFNLNVEESSSKAMLAIDGTGFDWSYMADEEASTNFTLMAFSDSKVERLKKEKENNQFKINNFENASKSLDQLIGNQISDNNKKGLGYNVVPPPLTGLFAPPSIDLSNSGLEKFKQPEFEGYGVKVNKGASENVSKEVKKTSDAPIIEDWVSDCDEDETVVLESLNVQKPKQADQPRKVSQNPRNNSTSWNTPMPKKLGVGFQFTPKACFVCGSFNHLIKDCDFHDKRMVQKPVLNNVKKGTGQREVRPVWTNAMRVNHQKISNSRRNFAPTAVLTKSGLVPFSTARQSFSRTTNITAPIMAARMTSAVGEQGINDVKPTAYWAWRPKIKMINHVYKNTGSCICKQFNYVDPTALATPGQTATGKESSNPFMAGSLPKTISPMIHLSQKSKESHVQTLTMFMKKVKRLEDKLKLGFQMQKRMTEAKDFEVCKITRKDGSSSFHGDIQALLRRLNRQDLRQLYSLGDLRMLFDPNEEDDIWLNQQYWELLRWKLHENSGVHSLFLDGTSIRINMLVEKKYPLKEKILEKMINLKIEAEEESTMAHELIKFINSQIAEQS
ncbi:hypothetical protein Tco_1209158 [Tanacetum coccineum]